MVRRTTREVITSDASLAQARKTSAVLKKLLRDPHSGHHRSQSVREEHYKGHRIVIKTSYDVTVDGRKFNAALAVSNSGNVEYHGMPNVGFASAVDLMRSVIDQFPAEFRTRKRPKRPPPPEHDHVMHDHETRSEAPRKTRRAPSRTSRRG